MNILAKFENDPWKITDVRALTALDRPVVRTPVRAPGDAHVVTLAGLPQMCGPGI